jgi:hypothetical protein
MAALMAYRVGVFDLALGVSAPEFTGELVVAKLVEQLGLDAPGELAGCRKKDRGRWKEEAEPEGQTALPSARGAAPFPIPKLAAQTLRRSGPLLRNAQPLESLCASDQPSALIARGMGATEIAKAVGCKLGNVYKAPKAAELN